MSLAILGINHKTASVSVRERVVFSPEKLDYALSNLKQHPLVNGCVILSTCNRTEIYLSINEQQLNQAKTTFVHWFLSYHNIAADELAESIYWYQNDETITHLMRVASGLDSLILGEPQILGQVKTAYHDAQGAKTLCHELEKLFHKVFSVAKRVRTETEIGSSPVSVAFAACTLAKQIFESFSSLTIMLVGAGETIELVARYLKQHQVKSIIIANRTTEKARQLAQEVNGEIISLPDIALRLRDADIVISSTASPLPIIGEGMVKRSLKARHRRPMLFIDIAVPRDVEAEVATINDVYLYTVDDLHSIIAQNLQQRKVAAQEAEYIIAQESNNFVAWLRGQQAVETICLFRQQAEDSRQELQAQALLALQQGVDAEVVVRELAHKLTNRLIHLPTKSLQESASHGDSERFKLLRDSLLLK